MKLSGHVTCAFCQQNFEISVPVNQVVCNLGGYITVGYGKKNDYNSITINHKCEPINTEFKELLANG